MEIRTFKTTFIPTTNYRRAQEICQDLLNTRSKTSNSGAVIGRAGRGKTQIVEALVINNPAFRLVTYTCLTRGVTKLYRAAAFALSGERPSTAEGCSEAIADAVSGNRRLLIIDEADRMSINELDAIRDLQNEMNLAVLFVGEEGLNNKLGVERRLHSRCRSVHTMSGLVAEDVIKAFAAWLRVDLEAGLATQIVNFAEGDWRPVENIAGKIFAAMAQKGLLPAGEGSEKKLVSIGSDLVTAAIATRRAERGIR